MARFRDEWTDPTDTSNGINRGQQWSPYSDNFSVYDANKIVNNLIHLKNRIVDGTGTILTLGGETVASMEVDSTPQETGVNRLVTSAGVANALKNFKPSGGNEYDDTELRELIDNKVDKVEGKQLSTNDYIDEDKLKLDGLENYDDTEIRGLIDKKANQSALDNLSVNLNTKIDNKVDKVEGMGLSSNDYTDEDKTRLSNLKNYDDTSINNRLKSAFVNFTVNQRTGEFVFTTDGGGTYTVNTLLEKVVTNFTYNSQTQSLELTLQDGTTQSVPMSAFIDEYTGYDGSIVNVKVENNVIYAELKDSTIPIGKLTSDLQTKINSISDKVDKITGKGLSTNDYTTAEKNKLSGLSNYDDTAVRNLINNKASLDGSNLSETNISSWRETLGITDNNFELPDTVEQTEVIYDMNDSTKDWGYSGGIQTGVTITGKDFSKYKYLKIYASVHGQNVYQVNFVINLTQPNRSSVSDQQFYMSSVTGYGDATYSVMINLEKTSIENSSAYTTGKITKIEGVY